VKLFLVGLLSCFELRFNAGTPPLDSAKAPSHEFGCGEETGVNCAANQHHTSRMYTNGHKLHNLTVHFFLQHMFCTRTFSLRTSLDQLRCPWKAWKVRLPAGHCALSAASNAASSLGHGWSKLVPRIGDTHGYPIQFMLMYGHVKGKLIINHEIWGGVKQH
jgi:hypothetical protein